MFLIELEGGYLAAICLASLIHFYSQGKRVWKYQHTATDPRYCHQHQLGQRKASGTDAAERTIVTIFPS